MRIKSLIFLLTKKYFKKTRPFCYDHELMKKRTLLLTVLTSVLLQAEEDDWSLNNSFTVWSDAAYYRRAQSHKHRLIIDESRGEKDSCGVCHFDACDAKHLAKKFKYEPGFRFGFSYMSEHALWEATYLWIRDWSDCCSNTNPGYLYFSRDDKNYFLNDFAAADSAKACYASWFQNAEVNYTNYVTSKRGDKFGAAWLAGLRYFFLDEKLDVDFIKGLNSSTYHVHVSNHIPALQVGVTLSWNPTRSLSWDFVAKVGLGIGVDWQHTSLGDLNNTLVIRDYRKRGFETPFLADGMLSLAYQPISWINLHTAYQFIYLNGVALAPDQLVKGNSSNHVLRRNGMPLIHGWTAGLSFSF